MGGPTGNVRASAPGAQESSSSTANSAAVSDQPRRFLRRVAAAAALALLAWTPVLPASAATTPWVVKLSGPAQIAFRVNAEVGGFFFDFTNKGGGRYVAAYFPAMRGGWVHLQVPGAQRTETLNMPFGTVPDQVDFKPHRTYIVDVIPDRPVTFTFTDLRFETISVHPRTFMARADVQRATVTDGSSVLTHTANRLGNASVSVAALAVVHRTNGSRAFSGTACSASVPTYLCPPDRSSHFAWVKQANAEVVGTTYGAPHPDAYLDGTYVLIHGTPVATATLCAFGLYFQ